MKRFLKSAISLLLILAAALCSLPSVLGKSPDSKIAKQLETTYKHLAKQNVSSFSTSKGEWLIMGLARSGYSVNNEIFNSYYSSVVNTLKENSGVISKNKYTEYSKAIIALTAIGKNPENVAGYNLLNFLADYNRVKYQGVNGVLWALIALDSNSYQIPKNTDCQIVTTRQMLINYLLDKELKSGGWSLAGTSPDCDITAMTITALSPYYSSDNKAKLCIDRALSLLSDLQSDRGTYINTGVENSESVAQVLVALCSLGINPDKDKRFIKNGTTLTEVLLRYSTDEGFAHQENGSYNQMSTEQCFYSMVAYKRLCSGESSLFDMREKSESPKQTTTITGTENNNNSDSKSNTDNKITSEKNKKNVETTTVANSTPSVQSTKPSKSKNKNSSPSKIEEINNSIKELKNRKITKKDKKKLDKILEEYDRLNTEDKKINVIEETKEAKVSADKDSSFPTAIVITTAFVLVAAGAIIIIYFQKKKRKSKEEKQ